MQIHLFVTQVTKAFYKNRPRQLGRFCFYHPPKKSPLQVRARIAAKNFRKTVVACSRETYLGGGRFETSSTKGDMGAVLVANATRPVLHGVSVLLIGNWLGLQISKPDDKQVNVNGGFLLLEKQSIALCCRLFILFSCVFSFYGINSFRHEK